MRQRALPEGPDRPPPRRRTQAIAAPGYGGRKRGEVVRSRAVLQQAHTHEWLGTFGEAGNGQRWPRLERAAQAIVDYLKAHGLASQRGVLRMDGEYGWAHTACLLGKYGVGYVMRCADYGLLKRSEVQAALTGSPQRFTQPDTGMVREVFDAGWVPWISGSASPKEEVETRLLVARSRPTTEGKPRIGQRDGEWVYELFVTDRPSDAFTAVDILDLYFPRGGFEQTLSEEDREIDPDRSVSGHPAGQELWQIVAQGVWNARLQLGLAAMPTAPRCTLWSAAEPAAADITAEPTAKVELVRVEDLAGLAVGSESGRVGAQAPEAAIAPSAVERTPEPARGPEVPACPLPAPGRFEPQPDGTLRCANDKVLREAERRGSRIRFSARDADCRACPIATACLESPTQRRGRRVDVVISRVPRRAEMGPDQPTAQASPEATTSAPPRRPSPPAGPEPLLWYDLPATSLRRSLSKALDQQRVESLAPLAPEPPRQVAPLTRDQRAHRRLRWDERLARNARPPNAPQLGLRLYGVQLTLAACLGIPVAR